MRYLKHFVFAAAAAFYGLALVLDRSANVFYTLLALAAVIGIACRYRPAAITFVALVREYWMLSLAMAMPLLVVLMNQLATGHFSGRDYDAQSRLALFAPVLWILLCLPFSWLKRLQWAIAGGALLALVKMYILSEGGTVRYGTDFIPIIICAHMGLLLGIFAVFSTGWNHAAEKPQVIFKIVALCAGLYMAYLSASRGVWATIFVYAFIATVMLKHVRRSYKVAAAAIFVAGVLIASQMGGVLKQRMEVVATDLQQYAAGTDLDTSLGLRLQLWKGSWILFKEHPVFGVGITRYTQALEELEQRKIITPFAATLPHSHNEMLFMMVRLGALGALALLAVYFVPLAHFIRRCRDEDVEVRCAAAMGIALVSGFIVLGLVDVIFLWWECYPFYALGVAYCMACIIKRRQELGQA